MLLLTNGDEKNAIAWVRLNHISTGALIGVYYFTSCSDEDLDTLNSYRATCTITYITKEEYEKTKT